MGGEVVFSCEASVASSASEGFFVGLTMALEFAGRGISFIAKVTNMICVGHGLVWLFV